MATFVIVHGAWGGGWEWTPVAGLLRQRGHDVFTPTLTGLGERTHLGRDIGLADHIADVMAVLEFEALRDVVLCGHSYGGMVVTGVADRVADCIRQLVYLDALVPTHGQAVLDLVPDEFAQELQRSAQGEPDQRMPLPQALLPPHDLLPGDRVPAYVARLRPHPLGTFTEPVRLSGAGDALPRAYVRCTGDPDDALMAHFAARAHAEGWQYRELSTYHDLQLLDPEGTAAVLHELVGA